MTHEASQPQPANPEFEGGSFTIHHLSDSPDGYQFITDAAVSKTTGEGSLTTDERSQLKEAMEAELLFAGTVKVLEKLRENRAAWSADRGNPELEQNFLEARAAYQNKGKKIGLRDIRVDGNELHAAVQIVHFPVYNTFAKPGQSAEFEHMSRATGVAMIVRTADSRLIVQHRGTRNASYADIPGASVAGMVDASIKSADRQPGRPDKLDTTSVLAAIYKEGAEELGLDAHEFEAVRIAGLAEDHLKVHDELLMLADTSLSFTEVKQASRTSNRNKNLGAADFEEKFIDIEASPEAIATLLTAVQCPLPPTHAAALVAAGYSIAIQERGTEFANQWRDQVEQGVRANYQQMDQRVTAYYERFPEAATQVPERFWGKQLPTRNLAGYTPAYRPTEQGLPSFQDEMVRTGLIPETRELVSTAYMFDVDGPLSDPLERRVTEEALFGEIIDRLQAGEPVALNSGRSVSWMNEQVVKQVVERIGDDTELLERFMVIGEKGGAWMTFNRKGEPSHGKVSSIAITEQLQASIDSLVADKYADLVGNLDPKTTMASLEMLPGMDLADFTVRKLELAADLQAILVAKDVDRNYRVDATTIAVDVESPYVGKAVGADRFLQHLDELGVKAGHFETYGDSPSDAEMADELTRRGQSVQFVYVGKAADLKAARGYDVVLEGDFSQGTLRHLRRAREQR